MPLTIMLQNGEPQVLDAVDPSGAKVKIMLITDPATGTQMHVSFSLANAAVAARDLAADPPPEVPKRVVR